MKKRPSKKFLPIKWQIVLIICLVTIFILTVGCSSINKKTPEINSSDNYENSSDKENDKEALYGHALIGLAEDNSSNNTALDKRFDYLNGLVNKILNGEKELEMATFTRIKIELDYLSMKNYAPNKVNLLSDNFMKAFAVAEKSAKENEKSNTGSLNDRYFSLSSMIEKISSGKTELKVVEYLQIEEGLAKLEQEGYIASRISSLRSKLFQAVIAELESAIVDYEIPEMELEAVAQTGKETESEAEVITDDVTEVKEETPKGPQTIVVKLINGGFNTEVVKINVGDTVEWKNVRSDQYKVGLVVGNRECLEVKSKIFSSGSSFNFTFIEPGTCWISDGIFTTQAMRVIVS
jgi:plastocyanin